MDDEIAGKARTLTDADISSERRVSRRSLLSALGLGLGVAAAAVVGGSVMTAAQAPNRCTDNDGGPFADPPERGRRCQPGGCTDTDGGRLADPPQRGRGCQLSGCTDNDGGPLADAPGRGRQCGTSQPNRCTDIDSGPNQDPEGLGIRCEPWI
jgi:hypothetical protein